MLRIKSNKNTNLRKKKIVSFSKGFNTFSSNKIKLARQQYLKSLSYIYNSRKSIKRYFRKFWLRNISLFLNSFNLKYNNFIYLLKSAKVGLNRKMLYFIFKKGLLFNLLNSL